jgi:hypothetical protein
MEPEACVEPGNTVGPNDVCHSLEAPRGFDNLLAPAGSYGEFELSSDLGQHKRPEKIGRRGTRHTLTSSKAGSAYVIEYLRAVHSAQRLTDGPKHH